MLRSLLVPAVAVATLALPTLAQWSLTEQARLLEASIGTNEAYGSSVDIDGNTAVVGVPRTSTGFSGRVFVYTRSGSTWSQQAVLSAGDDVAGNGFGYSVALENDTLVVGANGTTVNGLLGAGAAYVFTRTASTWTQQQKLVATDAESSAEFGYDVTVSGNTLAVGAPQSTTNNTLFAGATYVFTRVGSTWSLQQRIVPQGNNYGARSGRAVSLLGNSLLIGAPLWADLSGGTLLGGAVYEWTRAGATWSQANVLLPSDINDQRQFGCSIDRDGARAIIGAWAESHLPLTSNSGTAYVFEQVNGAWAQEGELIGSSLESGDGFGTAVSLVGTTAIVGAPNGTSTGGASSGTVRLFSFDGAQWTERLALAGSATNGSDQLGIAVAMDGDYVVAGANFADTATGFSGEAYLWKLAPPTVESYCTAKTNSLGCVPTIQATGTPSASNPAPFTVSAALERNQKLGLLFYGLAPNAQPFQGGLLCVAPPTKRLPTQMSGGSGVALNDCSGTYSTDFNARIQSGVDPALVAGVDVFGQWWSRDPGAPFNTGLTGGLRWRIQP